jgi:PKD repeat protein
LKRAIAVLLGCLVIIVTMTGCLGPGTVAEEGPNTISALHVTEDVEQFSCYFVLEDEHSKMVSSDGSVRFRIWDDLSVILYDNTFSISWEDFEDFLTILEGGVLAYQWHIPFSSVQKSDSHRNYLSADMAFVKGSITLSKQTSYVPYPDVLKTPNKPPVAELTGPSTGWSGNYETERYVNFDASGSSDPNRDYLTFSWEFGDGETQSYGNTTSHLYRKAGTYTVNLTVNDGHGGTDEASLFITIGDPEVITVNSEGIWSKTMADFNNGHYFVNITMTNQAPFTISVWSTQFFVEVVGGAVYLWDGNDIAVQDQLATGSSATWTVFFQLPDGVTVEKLVYDDRVAILRSYVFSNPVPEVITVNDQGTWSGGPYDYNNGDFFVNLTMRNQAAYPIYVWSTLFTVEITGGGVYGWNGDEGAVPDQLGPGASATWIVFFSLPAGASPTKLRYDDRVVVELT